MADPATSALASSDLAGLDPAQARVLLEWQVELGVTDALGEAPVDRYALPAALPARPPVAPAAAPVEATDPEGKRPAPPPKPTSDADEAVQASRRAASGAADLPALRAAMEAYTHCELKRGARSLVFSDGTPGAPLMIVGEAPGRDEDREGRPFVGAAGQLLDRMLAAIGRDRTDPDPARAVYITNVLPWRPPGNRTPTADEIAMLLPFLARHIALAAPRLVLSMGNTPLAALTGRTGITRARGIWGETPEAAGRRPLLPSFHPAYLLRSPEKKREAWADLQDVRDRLA